MRLTQDLLQVFDAYRNDSVDIVRMFFPNSETDKTGALVNCVENVTLAILPLVKTFDNRIFALVARRGTFIWISECGLFEKQRLVELYGRGMMKWVLFSELVVTLDLAMAAENFNASV